MPKTKQFDEKEVLNKVMELFLSKEFRATSVQITPISFWESIMEVFMCNS